MTYPSIASAKTHKDVDVGYESKLNNKMSDCLAKDKSESYTEQFGTIGCLADSSRHEQVLKKIKYKTMNRYRLILFQKIRNRHLILPFDGTKNNFGLREN